MWSSRREVLLLLALSGCGFTPAFGTKGPAQGLLGKVHVADPATKNDFDFVNHMAERLGRPDDPVYELTYKITTNPVAVGIDTTGAITRYNLTGIIDWTLTRKSDGLRMTGGHVDTFTSYSATGSTVAGLAAEADANTRLMGILADTVVEHMVSAAAGFPP